MDRIHENDILIRDNKFYYSAIANLCCLGFTRAMSSLVDVGFFGAISLGKCADGDVVTDVADTSGNFGGFPSHGCGSCSLSFVVCGVDVACGGACCVC